MKDYEKTWEDFWKGICSHKNGTLYLDQIQRELHDYSFLLDNVPKVYNHITGGKLSKPNYPAAIIQTQADDHYSQCRVEDLEEILGEIDFEIGHSSNKDYIEGLEKARQIIKEWM